VARLMLMSSFLVPLLLALLAARARGRAVRWA
jgi:hypothetical protein